MNKGLGDEVAVKRQYREEKDVEAWPQVSCAEERASRNLVEYIGAYNHVGQGPDDRSYVAVVTEFMSGGDIAGYIERQATMGWKLRVQLVHGAVSGLSYLHHDLMHRASNPPTCSLTSTGCANCATLAWSVLWAAQRCNKRAWQL